MGRSILTRLSAAAVAAYFLCAAILLPDLDAVLFHGVLGEEETRTHIEATGNPGCHAENCVLGAILPQGPRSGGFSPDITRLSDSADLILPGAAAMVDRSPAGTCFSRAPPSTSVS
jgi:hypothetical protein